MPQGSSRGPVLDETRMLHAWSCPAQMSAGSGRMGLFSLPWPLRPLPVSCSLVTPLRGSPNNHPAIFAASFVGGVIQTSNLGKQADKLGISPARSQRASPSGGRVEKLQSFSVAPTCVVSRRRRAIAGPSGYKVLAPEANALCSPNPCIG